ncbi:MAG: toll/interleukin-1 receptor domain-containing protein [Bacteroidia bacterium]|nr:toll/interleukin-1 receptor domain-containing protein [Bacteroidia bacterium]
MPPEKKYDVLLCHNSKDKDFVRMVAEHLIDHAGLTPWFDEWDLIPGESLLEGIGRGLLDTRTVAVFAGPNGRGPWQVAEIRTALGQQINQPDFRVIPVLIPGAGGSLTAKAEMGKTNSLDLFLGANLWVDLEKGLKDPPLWSLECGIRGVAPGRGRPAGQACDCMK